MKILLLCSIFFAACCARPESSTVSKIILDNVKVELEGAATGKSLEDKFKSIHTKDSHECIPRLLCEMAATAKTGRLTPEEASILAVFSNNTTTPDRSGKVPLNWYKFATDIGTNGTSADRCQTNFNKCPLAGEQLLTVFKAIIVKP